MPYGTFSDPIARPMPDLYWQKVALVVAQALSAAAASAMDLSGFGIPVSTTLGGVAGVLTGIKTRFFDVAAMDEGARNNYSPIPSDRSSLSSGHISINMGDNGPPPSQSSYGSWRHWAGEIGLNTTSAVFALANRYFLVTNLFTLFGLSTAASVVWPIVLCDTAFKMIFDLTNELYETNAAYAEYMNNGVEAKPLYANWRCTQAILDISLVRDVLAIIGTLEHSIVDDILPWLLFVPSNVLSTLANAYQNFSLASASARAFAVMTPLIGGFLACIIIFQTLLFETQHSYKAYNSILRKTDEVKSLFQSMHPYLHYNIFWLVKNALWLMPACHGAASASSIFIWLQNLLSINDRGLFARPTVSDILKSLGIMIATFFTFMGTAIGHSQSARKEAELELVKVMN